MDINAEGRGDRGVSQADLGRLWVDPCLTQQRRVYMPHIVQPYIRQAVPFQKTLKLPGQGIRRIGLPVGPAEDEGAVCLLPV